MRKWGKVFIFWLGFICLFVCFIIRKLEAADSLCLSMELAFAL